MTDSSTQTSLPQTSPGPCTAGSHLRDRIASTSKRLVDSAMHWARRHPLCAAACAATALSLSIALMIAIASAFESDGYSPYTNGRGSRDYLGSQRLYGEYGQDDYEPVDEYAESYRLPSDEFWGEARVGGMPMTSGTFDNSGQGAHVISVDGEVLSLPPY